MRLVVDVGLDEPAADIVIPPDPVSEMMWYVGTKELVSPAGFQFSVYVELGAKSKLLVSDARNETLLDVGLADQSLHVHLRLPTGELIYAWIDDRLLTEAGEDATLFFPHWMKMLLDRTAKGT